MKSSFKLSLLIVLTSLLSCLSTATAATRDKVKVGVIVALTGDIASAGTAFKNGITIGYEKLPQALRNKIELLYEDDAMKSANTVSAFNKLVSVNNINVVFTISSGTSNAIAPLAEQKRIPMLAIATDPKVVENRRYVTSLWVTAKEEVRAALSEINKRGYRRLARISSIHDFADAVNKDFERQNQGQVKIILDEEYPLEIKDFKPFINKLRYAKDVDAVYVILLPGQCGIFAKQLRQADINLPLFGFELFEDSNEVQASDGALVGAWYVNADDSSADFTKAYKDRFPKDSEWIAANGHDAILLLGTAIQQSTDPEWINKYLHTVKDFTGALGTYSASGDNRFTLPAAVKIVTASGFQKLTND